MHGGIIVYESEHASLGNGNRGLDKVGTLCMDCIWTVTGGPAFPTADDEHAEQSQDYQYNQPLFHNQCSFSFHYKTPKGKVSVRNRYLTKASVRTRAGFVMTHKRNYIGTIVKRMNTTFMVYV